MYTQNLADYAFEIFVGFLKYFVFFFILVTLVKLIFDLLGHYTEIVPRINPVTKEPCEDATIPLLKCCLSDVYNTSEVQYPWLLKLKRLDNYFIEEARKDNELKLNATKKVIGVNSNCPRIAMIMISVILKNIKNIHTAISNLDDESNFNLIAKCFKGSSKPTIVIDCRDSDPENVTRICQKLFNAGMKKRIIFVADHILDLSAYYPNAVYEEINHSSDQLTSELIQALLENEIIFQGKKLKLSDILSPDDCVNNLELLDKLIGNIATIGSKIEPAKIAHCVDRKFSQHDAEYVREDLIEHAKTTKIVIIEAEPGIGKSTEFKKIAEQLQKQEYRNWTHYVDLKIFAESCEKFEDLSITFDTLEKIIKIIQDNMLGAETSELDKKVFAHLFKTDRFIMFVNGVGEALETCNQFVLNMLKSIKKFTKNQLWISSTPSSTKDLEQNFDTEAFKLQSFTAYDDFMMSFQPDYVVCISYQDLIKEIWTKEIKQNPSDPNLYSIYSDFIRSIRDWSLESCSEENENLIKMFNNGELETFLHKKAFKFCFSEDVKDEIKILVFGSFPDISLSPEEISCIDVLYFAKSGSYQFIHKKFAAFFIADFCFKKIFDGEIDRSEQELENVFKILFKIFDDHWNQMKDIKVFLDYAVSFIKYRKLAEKPSTRTIFLKLINDKKNLRNCYIFHWLARAGCINLIKYIFTNFIADQQKAFKMWIAHEIIENLSLSFNVLSAAVDRRNLEFILQLWSFVTRSFNLDQQKAILFDETKLSAQNIFDFAVRNSDSRVFKFIIEEAKKLSQKDVTPKIAKTREFLSLRITKDENGDVLNKKREWGKSILFNSLRNISDQEAFLMKFNLLSEIFGNNVEELKRLLTSKHYSSSDTEQGWNVLHFACFYQSPDIIKTVCSLLVKVLGSDDAKLIFLERVNLCGSSTVDFVAANKQKYAFETFWRNLEKVVDNTGDQRKLLDKKFEGELLYKRAKRMRLIKF